MRFLFVDSIYEFQPGRQARGRFTMPHDCALPACLVAEAIGQLAGWIAMEDSQFNTRPVAGIVGECLIAREAEPRESIELAVQMEECEADAVSYAGSAQVSGRTLVSLKHCGAPMLPLQDFDDRDMMRSRFATLLKQPSAPVAIDRKLATPPNFSDLSFESDSAKATLLAPSEPDFYADHFPRRPVFPATLLVDAEIQLARLLTERIGFEPVAARPLIRISDVKLRTFIAPGQQLELAAILRSRESTCARFALSASIAGKRIASANLCFESQ
jgi:3-hydroxymyristoyl/3-hydroxydecanoyl-(acyl carrier protein) dehydratase